jgi:hypothetical protein
MEFIVAACIVVTSHLPIVGWLSEKLTNVSAVDDLLDSVWRLIQQTSRQIGQLCGLRCAIPLQETCG